MHGGENSQFGMAFCIVHCFAYLFSHTYSRVEAGIVFCDAKFIFHQLIFMLNYVKKLLPKSANCRFTFIFFWFRNEADSFSSLVLNKTYQKICSHQFTISCTFLSSNWIIFARLAENSCSQWTTLAKKESFDYFPMNMALEIFQFNVN